MISPEDKAKVEQRIDTFDQLLEEGEFIQQQRALGRKEGFAEGLACCLGVAYANSCD